MSRDQPHLTLVLATVFVNASMFRYYITVFVATVILVNTVIRSRESPPDPFRRELLWDAI